MLVSLSPNHRQPYWFVQGTVDTTKFSVVQAPRAELCVGTQPRERPGTRAPVCGEADPRVPQMRQRLRGSSEASVMRIMNDEVWVKNVASRCKGSVRHR
jgi:hypothetical protein